MNNVADSSDAAFATLDGLRVESVVTITGDVVARSADVAVDANAMLQQLLKQYGGRGGGKRELAQAAGLTGDPQAIVATAHELLKT